MRRGQKILLSSLLSFAVVGLTACGGSSSGSAAPASGATGASSAAGAAKGTVVIATAGFAEIDVLAAMYADLLQDAGYKTETKTVSNRELYEPALEKGEIGLVPDYAATMTEFLNRKVNGKDAAPVATSDAAATVAAGQKLAGPLGLKFLDPSQAADQNAFAVTKKFAQDNSLTSLSDLAKLGKPVRLSATEECPARPFCAVGLTKTYGLKIEFSAPTKFDSPETKKDVTSGKADLGLVGTTDGTLDSLGLVVLKDDKGLQLADNLVPVVGKEFVNDADLAAALNKLSSVLTTQDLADLIVSIDVNREKASDAADKYLKDKALRK